MPVGYTNAHCVQPASSVHTMGALKCRLLPLFSDTTAGGRCRGSRTRADAATVDRPSASDSHSCRGAVCIPGGRRRSRRRAPAMNGCGHRLRHRESAVSPSRGRNARVNMRRGGAAADRFVRKLAQMPERFSRHTQARGVFSENKGRGGCNLRCCKRLVVHRNQRSPMGKRRLSRRVWNSDWSARDGVLSCTEPGYVVEAIPSPARHPSPADVIAVRPRTGMIRSPRPWIRRDPGVTSPRIPRPRTVRIRIPARAGKVWPPHRATSAPRVHEAPVVRHVVQAIGIW